MLNRANGMKSVAAMRPRARLVVVRNSVTDNAGPSAAKQAGLALLASAALLTAAPAFADLNKYEAAAGGEFGIGSAQQWGEADISGKDFSGQVRR
jgi:hypothetical protein